MKKLKAKIFDLFLPFQRLEKRQKMVASSLFLTAGLVIIQTNDIKPNLQAVLWLTAFSFLLTFWSLREDIKGIEWLTLFILPTFFSAGAVLFYFLWPVRWLTRLAVAIPFAVSFYAILLTENIFNVAVLRTIALWRAAQVVSDFFTLITLFFLSATIFSLHLDFYLNTGLIFLVSVALLFQNLWAVRLEERAEKDTMTMAILGGLIMGELTLALSFLPADSTNGALFLVTQMYAVIGVAKAKLNGKIDANIVMEYMAMGLGGYFLTRLVLSFLQVVVTKYLTPF